MRESNPRKSSGPRIGKGMTSCEMAHDCDVSGRAQSQSVSQMAEGRRCPRREYCRKIQRSPMSRLRPLPNNGRLRRSVNKTAHDSAVGRIGNPSYAAERDGLPIRPTVDSRTVIWHAFGMRGLDRSAVEQTNVPLAGLRQARHDRGAVKEISRRSKRSVDRRLTDQQCDRPRQGSQNARYWEAVEACREGAAKLLPAQLQKA